MLESITTVIHPPCNGLGPYSQISLVRQRIKPRAWAPVLDRAFDVRVFISIHDELWTMISITTLEPRADNVHERQMHSQGDGRCLLATDKIPNEHSLSLADTE